MSQFSDHTVVIHRCPYCGHNKTRGAQPLVKGDISELVALGIEVPMIDQCLHCKATLSPGAFIVGSDAYHNAHGGA
jgi:hypothetical protein